MKYKLIKEYPGSPDFGTIVENRNSLTGYYFKRGNNTILVLKEHVEGNPDYWEKVNENLWWVVFTKEEALFKTYTPYLIECYAYHKNDSKQYFKTKEEAEKYILYNKPVLSLEDIKDVLDIHQRNGIELLIKSKL